MSFVKLEKRVSVRDVKTGASMSMRVYRGSPKPIAFLSLRSQFLEQTNFGKALQFDVSIGQDENAGKIRVVPNAKGIFPGRRLKHGGAVLIDLGHVPQFGDHEHKNQSADAIFVDGAAIITIPQWNDDDAEDEDEEDEPRTSPKTASAPASSTPAASAPKTAARSITHNGVTINLTEDGEAVTFKGRTVDVSPRGARLVEALAKVMPSCIGDSQLISILWGTNRPPSPLTHLDMVVRDLASLKKIGLELRNQKGIGKQLTEVGKA